MIAEDAPLSVEDAFALLQERNAQYQVRPQQIAMAHAVNTAFKRKETGIFEAGTGTGKSLAALIPAVLMGKRVVVSTATIALQEQYVHKDLPLLQEVLPYRFSFTLMKGRSNYLSLRRYQDTVGEQEVDPRLVEWVSATAIGDNSELTFTPPSQTWLEINSDRDDCLHSKCPRFADCFYFKAKERADCADVIVVNHALLLADAASSGSILPKYELLIVDEAQHIPEVARDVFSVSLSRRGLSILLGKAEKQMRSPESLCRAVTLAADELLKSFDESFTAERARIREPIVQTHYLQQALANLKMWLQAQQFENVLDIEMAREKLKAKAKALISTINSYLTCLELLQQPSEAWVVWVERTGSATSKHFQVISAPLTVAPLIHDVLFSREGLEASVWMSATLATGGEDMFGYFKNQIGIDERVVQETFSSPFDYRRQALLYLPAHLSDPNEANYVAEVAGEIEKLLHISQGRAFVLFTSYQSMDVAYNFLSRSLPFECRRQGDMPRKQLIDWFLSTPASVLFGTSSFWEGISIDGSQLSCVIIDRIPFQVPDDPIYEARCEAIQHQPGRSWFNELALPHAIMRLKQGVGRLIRTETDNGIVAILDPRLINKSYGRRIIECLPPMRIITTLSADTTLDELLSL